MTYDDFDLEAGLRAAREIIEKEPEKFNMAETGLAFDCGTVACIGGWAWLSQHPNDYSGAREFVMQQDLGDNLLYDLFFVESPKYPGRKTALHEISPQQAIEAIDKYLEGKTMLWDHLEYEEEEDT